MNAHNKLVMGAVLAAAITASPTYAAGDDHGHDHGDAPAAASGPALPRFAAVSEAFELVGVVNGKHLALYLDRFDDNSPVKGAQLELDVGGKKVAVAPHGDGEYEATLAEELKPGVIPVTVTVVAQGETDLLAGEIDIHEEEHADDEGASEWMRYLAWGAALAAAAGAVFWGSRRLRTRRVRAGGTA